MRRFIFGGFIALFLCALGHGYPQQKLQTSDAADYDNFGCSVDISGDWAAVGAQQDDNGIGKVSVYYQAGIGWTETQVISAGQVGCLFGSAVSLDGHTLVVGSPGGCAVDVYVRNGTDWEHLQTITGPEDSCFGCAVDVDGDRLAIGADAGFGSVYLYRRGSEAWDLEQMLSVPLPNPVPLRIENPRFGHSLALDHDTLVVGACRYSYNRNFLSGAAWVYHDDGTNWTIQADLSALAGDDLGQADLFGKSVAIDGDTVLVGSYRDVGAFTAGAAHVFVRQGHLWHKQQQLFASDTPMTGGYFGYSVSVQGGRAFIGASYNMVNQQRRGSVHEFWRVGDRWIEQPGRVAASDGADFDSFGSSLAMSGTFLISGARYHDMDGTEAGGAYVYDLCVYEIDGDLNDDCRVNMADFVVLSANWMQDTDILAGLSENWLVDCINNPGDGACVQ